METELHLVAVAPVAYGKVFILVSAVARCGLLINAVVSVQPAFFNCKIFAEGEQIKVGHYLSERWLREKRRLWGKRSAVGETAAVGETVAAGLPEAVLLL